jgi:hypothetical protein
MKKILLFLLLLNTLIFATANKNDKSNKIIDEHVKQQMEKEKKFAREQSFYQAKDYDFSGAEVNPESLKSLPDLEDDDFNMDSVYD